MIHFMNGNYSRDTGLEVDRSLVIGSWLIGLFGFSGLFSLLKKHISRSEDQWEANQYIRRSVGGPIDKIER